MDLKEQVIQTALKEIEEQSWGATEQYMQIHDVVRVNDIPEVARVDMEAKMALLLYTYLSKEKSSTLLFILIPCQMLLSVI